jgi:hypothetical protein
MENVYLAIVLAPLPARSSPACSARQIGRAGAHWVTILGVASPSCCRWWCSSTRAGRRRRPTTARSTPGACRRHPLRDRLPGRPPDGGDDGGGDLRVADGAHLHHRLHARRSGLPALLQLHRAVHLLHADAGDGEQLPAAVLRLGGGGPGVLPADRLLVQARERDLRQHEGLPGQPGRRLRLPARHRRHADVLRQPGLRRRVRRRAASWPA